MHNWLNWVWLIPIIPMLAAAWIAVGYVFNFNRGESGEKQTALTAMTASFISLVLILIQDVYAIIDRAPGQIRFSPWIESGEYRVYISFTLDHLGLLMATLVAVISLLIIKFSINYMHREAGYQRFFMIMSLFNGAMLLIMLAGNAVLVFIGWELAGISSYLLIAYAFNRNQATANATQAFVTNRIGDAGFTLAIALCFIWFGSVEWSDILNTQSGLSSLHIGMIAGGFIIAALIKSALAPFSPWIVRALEGPTPSRAIFYGSLMVHAGVYLLIRLEPLFMQDQALLQLLAFIGLLTLFYGFFQWPGANRCQKRADVFCCFTGRLYSVPDRHQPVHPGHHLHGAACHLAGLPVPQRTRPDAPDDSSHATCQSVSPAPTLVIHGQY